MTLTFSSQGKPRKSPRSFPRATEPFVVTGQKLQIHNNAILLDDKPVAAIISYGSEFMLAGTNPPVYDTLTIS